MPLAALQPQPRPKILGVVTVPTGGWTLNFKVEIASVMTAVSATIPAGDYFVAFDQQSDDFIWKLASLMSTAANALAPVDTTRDIQIYIGTGTAHKVTIAFNDTWYVGAAQDGVEITWTSGNGPEIAAVLGFDSSAADTSTGVNNPSLQADWHHGYAWYADDDGYIKDDLVEDADLVEVYQSVGPGGHTKAQFIGSRGLNTLALQFLPRTKVFSRQTSYGSTPVWPYDYNTPLECWWREARQGKRFRVYRDGWLTTTRFVERGTTTTLTTTALTDSTKSWEISPAQQFKAMLVYLEGGYSPWRSYISSHTATVLTLANAVPGRLLTSAQTYYIADQRYGLYTLDLEKMREFRPIEHQHLDEYEIVLPLLRYQA